MTNMETPVPRTNRSLHRVACVLCACLLVLDLFGLAVTLAAGGHYFSALFQLGVVWYVCLLTYREYSLGFGKPS